VSIFKTFKTIFAKSGEPRIDEPLDNADQGAAPDRRSRKRRDAREGTRALIIDDSPTIVAALKKFLRSAGCITLEANDAEKGIEIARTERPELIFLDIVLPGMNGFAALRVLRRDPATKDVPIIMISGNEQATEQFFGTRIGADDFMKKPFSRFEVFARIERLLDNELIPRRVITAAATVKPV
jgi:DNA-binding response OmpR family regulator